MARSDSEDVYEVSDGGTPAAAAASLVGPLEGDDPLMDKPNDTTIHSGHFMVSHVHDEPPGDPEETGLPPSGVDVGVVQGAVALGQSPCGGGTVRGRPAVTHDGCRSSSSLLIDGSLGKLFECMSLAHCNTLTSPKWRNFKGVNVSLKEKIRLNNIIWREWHMQYINGSSPIVCHFETPISSKNDGTLDYWKLRLDSLTRDYKRLSKYFARGLLLQPDDHELLTRLPSSYHELLQRAGQSTAPKVTNPGLVAGPMFSADDSVTMGDETINDIFDTLFTPFSSSSRGNSSNFNTQTSLEEFMDTLEPLPPPLAVDFRGFGRVSSSMSSVSSSAVQNYSMKLPIAFMDNAMIPYNAASTMQAPDQPMSSFSSQALSFGSAEELIALLQSQLASETSLEGLTCDPAPAVNCPDFSGINIQSDFTVSDDNLVTSDGSGFPAFSSDGINMQEYPTGDTDQLCGMFFLPDATPLPVRSMPFFAPVEKSPGSTAAACNRRPMQFDPTTNDLRSQDFLRGATRTAPSPRPERLPPGSSSLPRMKTSHSLETVDRGSRSLGSLQACEGTRSISNNRSSNESLSKQSVKGFRTPQNSRHLPQLQPRPPNNACSTAYRQKAAHVKQGTSLLLPKPPVQPAISSHNWSIVMTAGTDQLMLPLVNQFAVGQDVQTSGNITAQGNSLTEPKCRVRHKSDQSSAAKGTTIRPIAVFQPINPIQINSSAGRSLSKTNCSVSFLLDKNTTISPTPSVIGQPMGMQVHNLTNSIVLSAVGNSTPFAASNQPNGDLQNGAFGEVRSCPGIFETSFHAGDFSDSVLLSSSSARSRHTSNESSRSTSSHYDGNSRPRNEPRKQSQEIRRVSHISSEQKRRCNIKLGFDTLIGLIPELKDSSNSRVSKATALHKAADLCKKMKQERKDELLEMEMLRNEIKDLEADISACQSQLPATGAPPIRHPVGEQLKECYQEYFYKRTLENWKFFIFGTSIAQPLLKSFDEEVTCGDFERSRKSVMAWIQTHCALASLRPRVTNAMVELSKQTSILSNPSLVPDEVRESVERHRNSFR